MSVYRGRPSISLTGDALAGPLMAPRPAVKALLALVALAVGCFALGIALRDNPGSAGRSAVARAPAHSYRQEGLLSLPAGARAPVSAALGEDSPAYRVTAAAGGYRAHSSAQRLALRFTRAGVSVSFRHARLGLALRDIGYGNRLRPVGALAPRGAANRVSYALGDGLREWYANGPLGLEQGFDLERAPAGGGGPLTLSLALSGNLRARLAHGGVSLTGHGAALRYAGLVVRDARGRKLRAWLELRHERVLIRIADRGARYPLRIDPLMQNGELTASDQTANANFGDSVAVSGNTIVVGARGANDGAGAVYVFTRPAAGWAHATQTAELTTSDPENNSNSHFGGEGLGASVAIDGSTIVAGAPFWSEYSNAGDVSDQGAVYEWTLPKSGVWTNATQTAYLTATDITDDDFLGVSVAVQGSTIVAGAPAHYSSETPENGPGVVYVYTMPASGGWVNANQTAELGGYYPDNGDTLGASVAISGSTIVAGASQEQYDGVGNNQSRGGVYVWTEPASGGWADATTVELTAPSDLHSRDQLGWSVAVSGSTIVAGAPAHSPSTESAALEGAVYVWTLPPVGGWADATQPAELTAAGAGGEDFLGGSVAVSGSTVFAGAPGHQVGSNIDQGAVYEWTLPVSGFWHDETQSAELTATDGAADDTLGESVAASQGTIAVGAPNYINSGAGTAYVFGGGYTVSGTVIGESCLPSACGNSLISGGMILVKGTASDGTSVSQSATTDASGDWSVTVPNGSYQAGPTIDGTSFADLPSFNPGRIDPIIVSNESVPNQDFATCVVTGTPEAGARDGAQPDPVATAASAPEPCVSQYTITLKASIPQSAIVDPSEEAHYELDRTKKNPDGYNDTDYWFSHYLRKSKLTRQLASLPSFPACKDFSDARVRTLTEKDVKIEWDSYLDGKAQLGTARVTLAWNQSDQKMTLVGVPSYAHMALTKVYDYHLEEPDSNPSDYCELTENVPVMLAPVLSSAAGSGGQLQGTDFSVVAAWGIPFDPAGLKVDTDTTIGQAVKNVASQLSHYIESHPIPRFFWETGKLLVNVAKIAVLLHVAEALSVTGASAFWSGEALATAAESIEAGITGVHLLAAAKDVPEAIGILGGLLGYGDENEGYPVISAVVRGRFETKPYTWGNVQIPSYTTLAVSAATTKFPNIGLTISRSPSPIHYPGIETYSGVLPWTTKDGLKNAGNLYFNNQSPPEGLASAHPFLLYDSTAYSYPEGEDALTRLLKQFSNMKLITKTLREEPYELVTPEAFPAENKLAPPPDCTETLKDPQPISKHTICWQFVDGVS
jgi:hypothetical protein